MPSDARTSPAPRPQTVRLPVAPTAVLLVFVGIALGLVVAQALAAARSVVALVVAAGTGALLIDPPVELFSRYMRRALAMVVTLLIVGLGYGALNYALLGDLDRELTRLEREVPRAAARIEESARFGEAARDFQLRRRVEEAVDNLRSRTVKGPTQKAARRFGTYFVGAVLMLFLLSWGPRYQRGLLEQIRDPIRRARVEEVVLRASRTTRRYLLLALGQAAAAGVVAWAAFRLAGLPVPIALALLVSLGSLLPYVGLVLGGIPALLLAAGFLSGPGAWSVLAVLVALQVVQVAVVQPRVTDRVMYVGAAVVAVTFLVGYDLYGFGGGVYGYALAVAVLALTDALASDPVRAPSGAIADE